MLVMLNVGVITPHSVVLALSDIYQRMRSCGERSRLHGALVRDIGDLENADTCDKLVAILIFHTSLRYDMKRVAGIARVRPVETLGPVVAASVSFCGALRLRQSIAVTRAGDM